MKYTIEDVDNKEHSLIFQVYKDDDNPNGELQIEIETNEAWIYISPKDLFRIVTLLKDDLSNEGYNP
jgi:hypothetical protein